MKIKNLKLDNFAKFTKFEIEFDEKITHLIGINGAGKTTIGLTAIWACLKGISQKSKDGQLIGERFRFIGNNKATADIEITLIDESKNNAEIKIKNHISGQSNQITFETQKDYSVNNSWLNNLLSVAFLSAKNFTQLNAKEQALLLGIDTAKYDNELQQQKAEYTAINRQLRGYGELKEVPKAEYVDLTKTIAFNDEQKEKQNKIEKANDRFEALKISELSQNDHIKSLEIKLAEAKQKLNEILISIKKGEEYISELPKPNPLKDISEATEQNRKFTDYQTYLGNKKKMEDVQLEIDKNKSEQIKTEQDRLAFIKSFKFDFDNLTVDESGGLLLDERPIKEPYFSKGEIELIVANLYKSINPELKLRFIDDFELLDEDNQIKVVKSLLDAGFQIITARVGKESKGSNSILLRECKIAKESKGIKLL